MRRLVDIWLQLCFGPFSHPTIYFCAAMRWLTKTLPSICCCSGFLVNPPLPHIPFCVGVLCTKSCVTLQCASWQCLAADVLGVYSIREQSRLDSAGLYQLCPVMLQQLEAGTCRTHKEEQDGDGPPRPTYSEGQHGAPGVAPSLQHFARAPVITDNVSCTGKFLVNLK